MVETLLSADKNKRVKNAQVISIDFLILSVILMTILFVFLYIWNFLIIRWNNINDYNKQYLVGMFASESLVTSPGHPSSWENLEAIDENTTFGLVNERNVINNKKLERLLNISLQNYTLFKEILVGNSYDIFINITNLNRTVGYYAIGNPAPQLNETTVFYRFAFYNGSISSLKIEVWK